MARIFDRYEVFLHIILLYMGYIYGYNIICTSIHIPYFPFGASQFFLEFGFEEKTGKSAYNCPEMWLFFLGSQSPQAMEARILFMHIMSIPE